LFALHLIWEKIPLGKSVKTKVHKNVDSKKVVENKSKTRQFLRHF